MLLAKKKKNVRLIPRLMGLFSIVFDNVPSILTTCFQLPHFTCPTLVAELDMYAACMWVCMSPTHAAKY